MKFNSEIIEVFKDEPVFDGQFSNACYVDRMQEAFAGDSIDLATFRYSREDGNVEKFNKSTKHHVIRDWDLLNGFIKTVLVK